MATGKRVDEASRLSRYLVLVQTQDCFDRSEGIFVISEFLQMGWLSSGGCGWATNQG